MTKPPIVLAVTALAAALVACGAPAAPGPVEPAAGTGAYPRTVDVGGEQVTIAAEPQRVIALSTDVGEVALQLIGPDRVIAAPEYLQNESTSSVPELARQVANPLQSSIGADPEQFLALDPDLVLLTTLHDTEQDALELLQQAGIPTVGFTNSWSDFETYRRNVELLGTALGAERRATNLIAEHEERVSAVTEALAPLPADGRPVIAILRLFDSGSVFVPSPSTISYAAVEAAGGTNVADVLGLTDSGKVSIEQLVAGAPSHIVVLDSTGEGRARFAEILGHPGMAAVPAIAEDNVLVIPAGEVSSGTGGVAAVETIAAWLHPELVDAPDGAR